MQHRGRLASQRSAQRLQGGLVDAGEVRPRQIEVPPLQRFHQAAHVLAARPHQQQHPERHQQHHRRRQRAALAAALLVEEQDRAGQRDGGGLEDAVDERLGAPAHVRLHRHVEELHRGVVDGVAEDGV